MVKLLLIETVFDVTNHPEVNEKDGYVFTYKLRNYKTQLILLPVSCLSSRRIAVRASLQTNFVVNIRLHMMPYFELQGGYKRMAPLWY